MRVDDGLVGLVEGGRRGVVLEYGEGKLRDYGWWCDCGLVRLTAPGGWTGGFPDAPQGLLQGWFGVLPFVVAFP